MIKLKNYTLQLGNKVAKSICKAIKMIKFFVVYLTKTRPEHYVIILPYTIRSELILPPIEDFIDNTTHLDTKLTTLNKLQFFNRKKKLLTIVNIDTLSPENQLQDVNRFHNLKLIFLTLDPIDELLKYNKTLEDFKRCYFDYSYLTDKPYITYSAPGLSYFYDLIEYYKCSTKLNVKIIKIEDMATAKVEVDIGSGNDCRKNKEFNHYVNSTISKFYIDTNDEMFGQTDFKLLFSQLASVPQVRRQARTLGYDIPNDIVSKLAIYERENQTQHGKVIAFHTDDSLYNREASRMKRSLAKLEIGAEITVIPTLDNWVEGCALKSSFLYDARTRLRGPLLYVDVDAFLHKNPWDYLCRYESDVSVFISPSGELISSVILLNDTPGCLDILHRWRCEQIKHPEEWDQRVLQNIIDCDHFQNTGGVSVERLPPTFCTILNQRNIHDISDVYIEQLQASRESEKKWGFVKETKGSRRSERTKELEALLSQPDSSSDKIQIRRVEKFNP